MREKHSERLDRFRTMAAEEGFSAEEAEAWIALTLPAAHLAEGIPKAARPAEAAPPAEGEAGAVPAPVVARVGGAPLAPAGAEVPREAFVAAVDLSLLPPDATNLPLPADGHLLLFGTAGEGADGTYDSLVRHVPAGTPLVRHPRPVGGGRRAPSPYKEEELRSPYLLLSADEAGFTDKHLAHLGQDAWFRAGELDGVWQATGEPQPRFPVLWLGGHAAIRNVDPLEWLRRDEPDADWVHLATYHCGEEVEWTEHAVLHWSIRRADLAALRFDHVDLCVDGG
ncbi:DUF1963 domain-containing protein [Streptomyces sp. NPDC047046]|uniref:DUF1963 domain-containing protein n=1 Tax=Streptomyces sp. NPDC047046 TaxID=3155378 RepID=UPI0033EEFD61